MDITEKVFFGARFFVHYLIRWLQYVYVLYTYYVLRKWRRKPWVDHIGRVWISSFFFFKSFCTALLILRLDTTILTISAANHEIWPDEWYSLIIIPLNVTFVLPTYIPITWRGYSGFGLTGRWAHESICKSLPISDLPSDYNRNPLRRSDYSVVMSPIGRW